MKPDIDKNEKHFQKCANNSNQFKFYLFLQWTPKRCTNYDKKQEYNNIVKHVVKNSYKVK